MHHHHCHHLCHHAPSPHYHEERRSPSPSRTVRFATPTEVECPHQVRWSPPSPDRSVSALTYTRPSPSRRRLSPRRHSSPSPTIQEDTKYQLRSKGKAKHEFRKVDNLTRKLSRPRRRTTEETSFETTSNSISISEPWDVTKTSTSLTESSEESLGSSLGRASLKPISCIACLGVVVVLAFGLFVFYSYHTGRPQYVGVTDSKSNNLHGAGEDIVHDDVDDVAVETTSVAPVKKNRVYIFRRRQPPTSSSTSTPNRDEDYDGLERVTTVTERERSKRVLLWEGMTLHALHGSEETESVMPTNPDADQTSSQSTTSSTTSRPREIFTSNSRKSSAKPPKGRICETKVCELESFYFANYLNWSANPCQDFYGFVCSQWNLFYREVGVSRDFLLAKKVEESIFHALMSREGASPQMLVLGQILNMCVHKPFLGDPRAAVINYMSTLGLRGWPFVRTKGNGPGSIWKPAGLMLRHLGLATLLSVSVELDPEESDTYVVALGEPSLLIGQYGTKESSLPSWYETAVSTCFRDFTAGRYVDVARDVIDFSSKLAQISVNRGQEAFSGKWFKTVQLSHYKAFLPLVSIVFNNITHVRGSTKVLIKSEQYIKSLKSVIHTSKPVHVLNYLGFRAMLHISPLLPERAASLAAIQMRELTGLPETSWSRWRRCLRMFEMVAPVVFQQTYAQTKQGLSVNQDRVWILLNDIQATLVLNIKNSAWISTVDKTLLRKRLSDIKLNVFHRFWKKRDHASNALPFVSVIERHGIIQIYQRLARKATEKNLLKIAGSRRRPEWKGSVFATTPIFDKESNSVFVPMAMFDPVYTADKESILLQVPQIAPRLIGALLQGIHQKYFTQYQWTWSGETQLAYHDLQKCIEDEYGVSKRIRSDLRSEFNTLDNMAVFPALKVFLKMANQVNIEGYGILAERNITLKQLFFIMYARGHCETMDAARNEEVLQESPYSPGHLRVNAAVRSSLRFPLFWNCSSGSAMNPAERCPLWAS